MLARAIRTLHIPFVFSGRGGTKTQIHYLRKVHSTTAPFELTSSTRNSCISSTRWLSTRKGRRNIFDKSEQVRPVVKIGDSQWQANLEVDGEVHELGIFRSKVEAVAEVKAWTELMKDDGSDTGSTDAFPVLTTHQDYQDNDNYHDEDSDSLRWIRPDTVDRFDNPILKNVEQEQQRELTESGMEPENKSLPLPLTLYETVSCLHYENADDIKVLDITTHTGGGDAFGDFMIFVSGRSLMHLRKMGDVLVKILQKRGLWNLSPIVEGRGDDDGFVADICF